jgi:two-component system, chemotaxis family, CheB/CheR fusion protein
LKSDGLLFLGSSESIDNESALFRILDKKHRLYTRLAVNRQSLPMFTRPSSLMRAVELGHRLQASMPQVPMAPQQIQQHRSVSLTELHFKLLEEFSPGSVLIDKDDNIVHLSERAERYLHLGGGEATLNLLRVVHPMLRIEVRAAIFRARQTQTPVKAGSIAVELQGERYSVDLHVRSAKELAPDFLLVVRPSFSIASCASNAILPRPSGFST